MIWQFWLTILGLAVLSTDLYLAAAVYVDAKKQRRHVLNLSPAVWALVAFLFPLLGFFVYWLMHHSTLVQREKQPIDY